jgi:hypothetical protein
MTVSEGIGRLRSPIDSTASIAIVHTSHPRLRGLFSIAQHQVYSPAIPSPDRVTGLSIALLALVDGDRTHFSEITPTLIITPLFCLPALVSPDWVTRQPRRDRPDRGFYNPRLPPFSLPIFSLDVSTFPFLRSHVFQPINLRTQ